MSHLQNAATKLGITIPDGQETEAYLHLLQSAESVMRRIQSSDDYIHPALAPVATTNPRTYWELRKEENPLNAWRYRCELVAAAPISNLLRGKTIVIKDNISVGGLPTTVGTFTELLSKDGQLPTSPIDASVVSRILAAGATIKGSSTCENYCASPLSYSAATGPVHNALATGYTAGGSSSGSAALVAAAVIHRETGQCFGETVDIAIGGDQAGSVRNPASYSGIYGLKPTYGLVPYTGAVSLAPMIDHLGPLAANLEDIALLLQVIAGYDGIDPRMTPESPLRDQVPDYSRILTTFRNRKLKDGERIGSGMKVGLLKESFEVPGVSWEVRETVLQSAQSFFAAAGAEVMDISVPMHLEGSLIWTAATRMSMSEWACQGKTSGHLSFLPPHIQARWPPDQRMYELLTATNPAAMNVMLSGPFLQEHFGPSVEAKAHRKVFELRAAYDHAFTQVDLLVTPCAPTVAMPHPKMQGDDEGPESSIMEKLSSAVGVTTNTAPFNVTGHPAMSVPCGFGRAERLLNQPEVQLPIGMQLVGRRWEDAMVLKAAAVFEEGRSASSSESSDS
ncbi:Amidase [Penicillium rolfsii]|nr:Amidase [Penicillium rolfsii]